MTALNLGEIPSNINSLERLAMWVGQALHSASNGLEVNAVAGEGSVPAAQVQIAKTADNVDRAIIVLYLPITYNALNSSEQKTWMAAEDLTTAAPHSSFFAN